MSEERLTPTGSSTPKKVKKKGANRFGKWFREMKSELKKVVWPTPKQVRNNTIVSLVVMAIFAVIIWGFDQAAGQVVRALISLGG